MTTVAMTPRTSKWMLWTGRVISAIPVLFMGVMALAVLVAAPKMATDGMVQYGYPAGVTRPLLVVEILCAVLYLIPQTAALGAILLTGYLGGAVATHVRAGEPFYLPVLFGVVVWLGLYLRDARLRALVPLRQT
jgi:hypothetical protein